MKKAIVWIGTVIGVAAVLTLAMDMLGRRKEQRTISVNGECLTTAPRDKTAITLRVTTLAPMAIESMQMATTQVAQITATLKSMPVEMQTTQFNSYEKTEWNREEQKSVSLGIETTIAVEVSADNIKTIEDVLTQFAGAANVYSENLRMYTSPAVLKKAQEDCLAVAVENARVRANALATGDGKQAGKLIAIDYGATNMNTVRPTNLLRASGVAVEETMAMDAGGTIITKDTDVAVSVRAMFEIK